MLADSTEFDFNNHKSFPAAYDNGVAVVQGKMERFMYVALGKMDLGILMTLLVCGVRLRTIYYGVRF